MELCAAHIQSLSEAKKVSVSEQSVQTGVSLASLAHEAGKSKDVFLSGHLALLVDLYIKNRHAQNLVH